MTITLSQSTIHEGSILGAIVGTLTSDILFGALTWQIVNDPTGGGFAIDGDRLVVLDGALIDFETLASIDLQIEATDAGSATDTSTLPITVLDLNEITGTAGDDVLVGTAGDDLIEAGDGDDNLDGGVGNDILRGGDGYNIMVGGAGNDQIVGGTRGDDVLDYDVADYSAATGSIIVNVDQVSSVSGDASVGTDTLTSIDLFVGTSHADDFTVASGFAGKSGDDWVEIEGGGGNDTITGNGTTRISFGNATEGVTVDLGAGSGATTSGNDGGVGIDTFSGVYSVRGSQHNDILIGTDDGSQTSYGFEEFRGQDGDDIIQGGGGFDRADYRNSPGDVIVDLSAGAVGAGTALDGWGGTDTLSGIEDIRGSDQGNDTLTGDAANNQLRGMGGNDNLFGGSGRDDLRGGTGDDYIDGGQGNDILRGDAGADNFVFSGPGFVVGDDTIRDFTSGEDIITFDRVAGINQFSDLTFEDNGAGGTDIIAGPNRITLWNVNPVNLTALDFDIIPLDAQQDIIGTAGDDTLTGTTAADLIDGDSGDDDISGGFGDDVIIGGAGDDTMRGEAGADQYIWQRGDGFDVIEATGDVGGNDIIAFTGEQFYDINFDWSGDDLTIGVADSSSYDYNEVGGSITLKDFRLGNSSVVYFEADTGNNSFYSAIGDVSRMFLTTGQAGIDQGNYTELLLGTDAAETISGGGGYRDYLYGFGGDDNLIGGLNTNAEMRGGAGNDTLTGTGYGYNRLSGGVGNDTMQGGAGVDMARYSRDGGGAQGGASSQGALVNLSSAQADLGGTLVDAGQAIDTHGDTDTLISIEDIDGSEFGDIVEGSDADNFLRGRGGDDDLRGGLGDDSLRGDQGSDTLSGGSGFDYLYGGSGDDNLSGGADGDIFDYRGSDGNDTITDFEAGVDTIVLGFGTGVTSFAELTITDDGSGNAVVAIPGGGQITLMGIAPSAVDGSFFNIEGGSGGGFGETEGPDTLVGTEGDDFIDGLDGDDIIDALGGNDFIVGGYANDTLTGGAGADTFYFILNDGDDVILDFTPGEDVISLEATTGVSRFDQLAIADNLDGNAVVGYGSGTITLLGISSAQLSSSDFALEGVAFDFFELRVVADLDNGTVLEQDATRYVVENTDGSRIAFNGQNITYDLDGAPLTGTLDSVVHERSDGSALVTYLGNLPGIDQLAAEATQDDVFNLLFAGNNTITISSGLAEIVHVEAGAGDDNVTGADGHDIVQGGDGDDLIDGGASGSDIAQYWAASHAVNIDLQAGTVLSVDGNDTLIGIDAIDGSAFDDIIAGNDGDNRFWGLLGDDTLTGRGGADQFTYWNPSNDPAASWGDDTITDFTRGEDIISIDGWAGIDSFADLAIADNLDGDAVVSTAFGSITLQGVTTATLDASDFNIIPAAGTGNTAPVITTEDLLGEVVEDTNTLNGGIIGFDDADIGDFHTATASLAATSHGGAALGAFIATVTTPIDGSGQGGIINWAYALDTPASQYLAFAEQVTETYTVSLDDGAGNVITRDVVVTITGSNDAPTVSAAIAASAAEDAVPFVVDLLANASDVDTLDILSIANLSTLPDGVTLNPDGTSVTVDPTHASFQSLGAGQQATLNLTYNVVDQNGGSTPQTAIITIDGADESNTAPSVADVVGALGEDGPGIDIALAGEDADADDTPATLTYAVVAPPSGGTASIAGQTLTFDPGSDFDYLSSGASTDVVFTYQATDSHGAVSGQATVTVTVTGANDQPSVGNVAISTGADDGPIDVALVGDDADSDDDPTSLTYEIVSGPATGSAEIVANLITFDPGAAFEALGSGQSQAVTITYQARDQHGAVSSTATVTITVTGTNSAPEIDQGNSVLDGFVAEDDQPPSFSGIVAATDADANAVLSFAGDGAGTYGSFDIEEATGAWTYTLDTGSPLVQALSDGDIVEDSFTVTVTDDQGASTTETVNVTILGASASPAIISGQDTGSVAEDSDPLTLTASGLLAISDADPGEAQFQPATLSGTHGSLSIDALGAWSYTADNTQSSVQNLNLGQSLAETFTVSSVDGTTHDIVVTITGANDAPTVSAIVTGAGAEGDAPFTVDLLTNAVDIDAGAVLSVTNLGSLAESLSVSGSTLTVDTGNPLFNILGVGESVLLEVTYDVTDEHGATAAQTARVTVSGTNDAPVVSAIVTANATEDTGVSTVDLLANASDPDLSDTLSIANVSALPPGLTLNGTQIDVDTADASFQSLAAGQTQVISITYNVDDGHGGSAPQTAEITITGSNDGATITGVDIGAVTEDDDPVTLTTSGALAVSDVDAGEAGFVGETIAGAFGSLTIDAAGAWTFTADNTQTAIQELAASEALLDSFAVQSLDGTGHSIVISIHGTNDAPEADDDLQAADEDGPALAVPPASGLLAISRDRDQSNVLAISKINGLGVSFSQSVLLASGAILVVEADGSYAYDPNGAFEGLAAGDNFNDSFTYTVSDGTAETTGTVTIVVAGANDAPLLTGLVPVSVPENIATVVLDLAATDADAGANLTFAITGGDDAALFTIDPLSGEVTFVNAPDFEAPADGDGDNVYQIDVSVSDGTATTVQSVTITVTDEPGLLLTGTNIADELHGSDENDVIDGLGANDLLYGAGGNDSILGGSGNDLLDGGDGDDILDGGVGADTILGGAGDDTIIIRGSESTNDIIDAGETGEVLGDTIQVDGAGAVRLSSFDAAAAGVEHWVGNTAGIEGTAQGDLIDLSGLETATDVGTISGLGGDDTITGTSGNDIIEGGIGADHLDGGAGDDTLTGGAGIDIIVGGEGEDTIIVEGADALRDTIDGGIGNADVVRVLGGGPARLAGFDTAASGVEIWQGNNNGVIGLSDATTIDLSALQALSGLTYVDGGGGDDTLTGSVFADDLRGGAGDDILSGLDGADTITGGRGDDIVLGGDGDDTIVISGKDAIGDTIDAEAGTGDTIVALGDVTLTSFDAAASGIEIWLGDGGILSGTNAGDMIDLGGLTAISGLAAIDGGGGDDLLIGSLAADVLLGGRGNDTIEGGEGDDQITGGNGVDTIRGGAGDDTIFVERFDSLLDDIDAGETGEVLGDTLQVLGNSDVILVGFDSQLNGIENWVGNGHGLVATSSDSLIDLSGLQSVSGLSFIDGSRGNDTLIGSGFADEIRGGSGDDHIEGGAGDDRLVGNAGADSFFFSNGWGADVVADFASGQDVIDLQSVAGVSSLTDLTIVDTVDGVSIAFGSDTILLENLALAQFDAGNDILL